MYIIEIKKTFYNGATQETSQETITIGYTDNPKLANNYIRRYYENTVKDAYEERFTAEENKESGITSVSCIKRYREERYDEDLERNVVFITTHELIARKIKQVMDDNDPNEDIISALYD